MGGVDAMVQSVVLNPKGQLRRLIAKASEAALQKINLDEEAFMRLLTCENEFRSYVESGVRRFTTENPDYEIARTILGKDFISPEEVMRGARTNAWNLCETNKSKKTFLLGLLMPPGPPGLLLAFFLGLLVSWPSSWPSSWLSSWPSFLLCLPHGLFKRPCFCMCSIRILKACTFSLFAKLPVFYCN
jgi:hypothetical protein